MLHINGLTYRIGGRLLLEDASVAIPAGHKVGLVGRNGAGKSTLFRLILGELQSESGGVSLPRNARIGTVAQEAPGGPESLIETVMAGDAELTALTAESEAATDPARIAEIQIRLADMDAHSAESRAATILGGLGFSEERQKGPCAALSGGWRMRVALAAALFGRPDVLLLDEPTNYLDLEGTIWLQSFIRDYPHTILMISHDRDLLNQAVNSILHLDRGKLVFYQGNYDSFERQRREKQALTVKQQRKQEDQRKHMMAFVERFRYKASKARQAQSRLKALSKLEPIAEIVTDRVAPFFFPNPEKAIAPPLARWEKTSVGYAEGQPVLKNITLRMDPDDRIALLGSNGNGKSTFAKLLCGKLPPNGRRNDTAESIDDWVLRPASAGRTLRRTDTLQLLCRTDAQCERKPASRQARCIWIWRATCRLALRHAVGRREGAASVRSCFLPCPSHSRAGRTDQSP